jgi:hypothetical protein
MANDPKASAKKGPESSEQPEAGTPEETTAGSATQTDAPASAQPTADVSVPPVAGVPVQSAPGTPTPPVTGPTPHPIPAQPSQPPPEHAATPSGGAPTQPAAAGTAPSTQGAATPPVTGPTPPPIPAQPTQPPLVPPGAPAGGTPTQPAAAGTAPSAQGAATPPATGPTPQPVPARPTKPAPVHGPASAGEAVNTPVKRIASNSALVGLIEAYIELYTQDGKALGWSEFESVTATADELGAGDRQACPQEIYSSSGDMKCPVFIPLQRFVRVQVQANYANGRTPMHFTPVVTYGDCGDDRLVIPMMAIVHEWQPQAGPSIPVTVNAHWCAKRAGRHERMRAAEIASATAKLVQVGAEKMPGAPPDHTKGEATTVNATVHRESARFNLQQGKRYLIDIRLKEESLRSCPTMPFHLDVTGRIEREIPICFEPCERVVALFVVDNCGQPIKLTDLQVEGSGQPQVAFEGGVHIVSGAEVGVLRVSSQSFDVRPSEFHIGEGKLHAFSAKAVARAQARAGHKGLEEIAVDLAEALAEDRDATLKVLTADRKLLHTVNAGDDKMARFYPENDDPLVLQCFTNRGLFAEVMHHGKS